MMVRMPAARARRMISAIGKMSAVWHVMWLMKMTFVAGVTADQKRSTKSSGVVMGSGIG